MNHYKLNGASPLNGLNAFGINDIKGYMSLLSCIGGTAYNEAHYKSNVTKIVDFFNQNLEQFNSAIAANNMNALSAEANEIAGMAKLMAANFRTKRNEKSWNSCSGTNLDRTIDLCKFYSEGVVVAMEAYLNNYFTKSTAGSVTYTSTVANSLGIWGLDPSTKQSHVEPKFNYSVKSGVSTIPKLEITPYVADKLKNPSKQINLSELLSGLSTVIASFGGSSSGGGGGISTGTTSGGTGSYTQDLPDNTKNAGFGVLGWVMVAGALGYAFTQMKDKPLQSAQRRQPRKSTSKK